MMLNWELYHDNVQELFRDTDVDEFDSVVVPDKTQYIFFKTANHLRSATSGVIAATWNNKATSLETLKGIRPLAQTRCRHKVKHYYCTASADGFVYRQEQGNEFDGNHIIGRIVHLT